MAIQRGRRTHDHIAAGEGLVVFNIGMTFNRPWRVDLWLPTLLAMPRMLAELSRETERGLVGYELLFGLRGPWIVQYWRDVDALYAYASAPEAKHRPVWGAFNRRARRAAGAVGIWHETYPVRGAETMYVDMPPLGLGSAVGTVPVTGRLDHARDRLENRS